MLLKDPCHLLPILAMLLLRMNHTMGISKKSYPFPFLAICHTLLLSNEAIEPYCGCFDNTVLSLYLVVSNYNETSVMCSKDKENGPVL